MRAQRFISSLPRVAVVGLGRMGIIRAEIVARTGLFELSAVVDADEQKAESVARTLGAKAHFRNLSPQVLEGVDAVIISTPTVHHFDAVEASLMARKPVMIEKPLTNR